MARRWATAVAALLGAALLTPLPAADAAGFGLVAPAQVRTDGVTVALNVGDLVQGPNKVRVRFTLDGPEGTAPADLDLLAPDPSFTMVPLVWTVEPDGDLVGVFGPATGLSSFPAFGFGLRARSTAPLGPLHIVADVIEVDGTGAELGVRESATADTVLYAEVPDAPSVYSLSPGDKTAGVFWRAPADDGGRPITGYTVSAHPDDVIGAGSDVVVTVVEPPQDSTPVVLSGLDNGRTYTVSLVGSNAMGTSLPVTGTVVPGPPPDAPVIAAATPVHGWLEVTFAASAPGAPQVTDYTFEQQYDGGDWEWVHHEAQPDDSVLVRIPSTVLVHVRVRAHNDSGYGGYSATTDWVAALEPRPADLLVTSSLATNGTLRLAGSWSWPSLTWPAKVCVTPGSDPAPSSCSGFTVTGSSAFAPRDIGADPGSDYTVTVRFDREIYGGDTLPHGRWSDPSWVTLTSTTVTAGDTSLKIEAGEALTLSGQISGLPVAPTLRTAVTMPPVSLWSRPAGTTWTKIRTETPDSTGRFSATGLRPVLNTTYQWRYAGDSESLGDVSPAVVVEVAPRLTAKLSRDTVPRGGSVRLWGKASPAHAGGKVALQRLGGGRWITVSSGTIKKQRMPNGASMVGFNLAVPTSVRGSFTYRAHFVADRYGAAANSSRSTLRVG